MPQDYSDKEVAATFRKLNASHSRRETSRVGIYVSWAAIVLLAACFFFVAYYVIDADRRAEKIRLKQTTDLVVQSVEARLLATTELLQKTSMRLMHIPGANARVASAELAAIGFMQDRREVLELALVDQHYKVLRHWASPSRSTFIPHTVGRTISVTESRAAIDSVLRRDASVTTSPYTFADQSQVFVNIYVPTPAANQILLARLNFSRLITEASNSAGDSRYVFYMMKNGSPLGDQTATAETTRSTLTYAAQIPMLNDPTLQLVAVSYAHNLFSTDNLKLWIIAGLAGLLALALTLLLRNQNQQHKAHQRLSAEYSLRVAMAESSLAGIRVTDCEGRILFVNDTFQKLVTYSADELIGTMPPYPYWVDDVSDTMHDILAHPDEHHARTLESRIRRKDGLVLDAQLNVSPLRNESHRIIGWIGELYDITEQKRARERMNAAHERFTRVVHSMNSAICVIGTEPGEIKLLFHNAPYARIFGPTSEGAARLLRLMAAKPSPMSRDGVFDDETQRWFDSRMQALTWTDGTPARMIIATDITNQRETELALEAQLRRAETTQRLVTMGEMASSLAHELNQPLAAISNYATGATFMLEAGKLTRDDTLTALGKVNKQAQRAAAIIKRIRGFAAAKKTDPQFTSVAPETLVVETMELALIQADKLGARIETVIEPSLPAMKGDLVMLEQLLLNLLKNAMEAVLDCQNHTVELHVARHETGNFIEFRIVDHGSGIPDENKSQLFDAFYSTKNEGMGMGLNICRSIVEIHHGRIQITDTEGGGATFSFTVPVARENAELM